MKGHEVIVGEVRHPSLASSSRHCSGTIIYPDPITSHCDFSQCVYDQVTSSSVDVILPVSDVTMMTLVADERFVSESVQLPFAGYELLQKASDKAVLVALAKDLEIPVPETVIVHSLEEAEAVSPALDFPMVIKPHLSRILEDGIWKSTGVGYAFDLHDLLRKLGDRAHYEYPILLQEQIKGEGSGIFTVHDRGRQQAVFAHRRIREKPPSGGVSVLRESVPPHPLAMEYSKKLLDHLDWHGVAMVEFKIDERDNIPKLMEINARFWGSLQLAIDAGVDFPSILIGEDSNQNLPKKDYRYNVKSRWFWGDVDSLLMTLFKKEKDLKVLGWGEKGKIMSLLEFVRFWEKDTSYEILRLSDIRPWLFETRCWFMEFFGISRG